MKNNQPMKKLLGVFLVLCLALFLMPGQTLAAETHEIVAAQPAVGDGSAEDPYQITTAAELYWFADFVNSGNANACAKLMNDITVNENVIVDGALNSDTSGFVAWTPIGVRVGASTKVFSGTFDGGNHTIRGLYVAATSGYQGLIGFMESGTVKNVTVADSYFSGTTNIGAVVGCYGQTGAASVVTNCHNVGSVVIASDYYVGGIVGGQYAPATSHAQIVVSDCSNSGCVTGAKFYVGGIIGYAEYFSEGAAISNCTNTGTVICTSTSSAQGLGGIAGYFGGSTAAKVEIVDCTNSGKVSIVDGGKQDYAGGIVGNNKSGHISDCNNSGTVSAYRLAGGIVGNTSGSVTNCQNTGAVSAAGSEIGGIAGTNSGTVTGCTNSAAVQGNYYVGGIVGSGIGSGLSGCTNTGDVTATTYGAGGVTGYVNSAGTVENCHNEGDVKGTRYIGGLVGYHYSGKVTYTGCSNKGDVEGSSYDIGGLFGRITDSSLVTQCYNAGNVTCTGTYSTSWDYGVGGLAGATFNAAMFENCYNTGAVNGGGNQNVGGLVGFFTYASGSTNHYIKNCYNTGAVTGGKNTGGLCGSYEAKGVSENCYNTGAVSGTSYVGGLVGYHKSTGSGDGVIKNCYNTGAVSGTSYVGGLFGYQYYNDCLETSYNAGPVSGSSSVGGVNGRNNTSVIHCYYLNTCVTGGNTVTGATALTADQMTDDANWKTNYAGFDTTTPVWTKENNEANVKYLPKLDNYSPTLHVHSWTYTAVDTDEDGKLDTITASCAIPGCADADGGSVTLAAPADLVYSGASKDAVCTYTHWLPDETAVVYNETDRVNVTGQEITASVTLGEGEAAVTVSVSYQVVPRTITASMVTLSPSSATYDGTEKTVTVTVKYNGTTLAAAVDYDVAGTTSATQISTGSGYPVTVTGKGNYTGTVTKYWKINKISVSLSVSLEGWTYGDAPNTPVISGNTGGGEETVTYCVRSGRSYVPTDATHGAATEGGVPSFAGTYFIQVEVAETEYYKSATKTVSFVISPREVTEPVFAGLQESYPYDNGNEIKPAFTLKDDLGNVIPESEYTVTYSGNTEEGSATITVSDVTGGNYIVSGTATFQILQNLPGFRGNLVLNETIDLNLIIPQGVAPEGNVFSVKYADGSDAPYTLMNTVNGWVIRHSVTANAMTREITVQILDAQGEPLTKKQTISVRGYAQKLLAITRNDLEKAMMIRMLDYGALAQLMVDANATDLANSIIDADLRSFMDAYDLGQPEAYTPESGGEQSVFLVNLTLNQSIDMNIITNTSYMGENEELEVTLDGVKLTAGQYALTEEADGTIRIRYSFFADRMYQELTVSFVDKESGEASVRTTLGIRKYAHACMEAYSTDTTLCAMLVAMMDYGALAQQYAGTNTTDLANRYVSAEQRAVLTDYAWPVN